MGDTLVGGRFRLLERHAVGGMATLWRARDERTGEVVAVKRLHPYLVADPGARTRLLREAAALQAVDHPAIIRPREVIDDPDDPVLVMEFAAGRSLQARLADDGPLDPGEAVAIAATVADALAVAHLAGIVHRDVKPANILVEDSGAVHLVDFGIASLAESGEEALTATRTMVGTLRYTAPERLAGAQASPASDVWALGAVLYELLTGQTAVTGGDPPGALGASQTALPALDDLAPGLAGVVQRAMAQDPADRYPDASAFRDALFAAEAPVDPEARTVVVPLVQAAVERPVRNPERSISPVDRAAAVFFGAVAVLALAGFLVLGIGGIGQAAEPATSPAIPSLEATPSATDVIAPPSLATEEDRGNGKGKGQGRGKGNGD